MRVLITGGTGFIGLNLVCRLSKRNHEIIVLTRNVAKASKLMGVLPNVEFCSILDQIPSNAKIDYIINLAGAQVSRLPWTPNRREVLVDSRLKVTEQVLNLIKRLKTKPKKLLNASSTGWYSENDSNIEINEEYTEKTQSFTHSLYDTWEKKALEARACNVEVIIMRFGLVLGLDGGILKYIIPLFKYGLGFYISSGNSYLSWIDKNDLIESCLFLMQNNVKNTLYNITSPYPVTNKTFSKELGKYLQRPVWLKIPKWLIACMLGDLGKEVFLANNFVVPDNLLKEGFSFQFENLSHSLSNNFPNKTLNL